MSEDTFREIERAHEAKYKLDEELRFKVQCVRNRRLGAWAAERMGMAPADAEAYAKRIVGLGLDPGGMVPLIETILADLGAAGVEVDRAEIVGAIDRFDAEALVRLSGDYPQPLGSDHIRVGG